MVNNLCFWIKKTIHTVIRITYHLTNIIYLLSDGGLPDRPILPDKIGCPWMGNAAGLYYFRQKCQLAGVDIQSVNGIEMTNGFNRCGWRVVYSNIGNLSRVEIKCGLEITKPRNCSVGPIIRTAIDNIIRPFYVDYRVYCERRHPFYRKDDAKLANMEQERRFTTNYYETPMLANSFRYAGIKILKRSILNSIFFQCK